VKLWWKNVTTENIHAFGELQESILAVLLVYSWFVELSRLQKDGRRGWESTRSQHTLNTPGTRNFNYGRIENVC
jgi:hypothetical protein